MTTRVAPRRQPMLSWVSAPSETLPGLGSSYPPEPESSNTRHHPKDRAHGSRDPASPEGFARSPQPGETSPSPKGSDSTSSAESGLFRGRPVPSRDDTSCSRDLGADGCPPVLAFEALKHLVGDDPPKSAARLSWGFLPPRRPRSLRA